MMWTLDALPDASCLMTDSGSRRQYNANCDHYLVIASFWCKIREEGGGEGAALARKVTIAFASHVAAGLTNQRGSLLRGLEAAKLLKTCLAAPSWCVCSGAGAENRCAHDVYHIHMRGYLGHPSPCTSLFNHCQVS